MKREPGYCDGAGDEKWDRDRVSKLCVVQLPMRWRRQAQWYRLLWVDLEVGDEPGSAQDIISLRQRGSEVHMSFNLPPNQTTEYIHYLTVCSL